MIFENILSQVLGVSNSFFKLKKFVISDMASLLNRLGRLEYTAAIRALRDATRSDTPEREVNVAITCLRLAYETFLGNASSRPFFRTMGSEMLSAWTFGMVEPWYVKASKGTLESCFFLTICYKAVEDKALFPQYLGDTKKAFEMYAKAYCDAAVAATSLAHQARQSSREKAEEEMVALRKRFHEVCDNIAALT